MLQSISWQNYFIVCGLLLFIYYAVFLYLYYREDFLVFTNNTADFQQPFTVSPTRENDHNTYQPKPADVLTEPIPALNSDQPVTTMADALVDELEAYTSASGNKIRKIELMLGIQHLIKKHLMLKGSPFQAFVNTAILEVSAKNCGIVLSEAEMTEVWNM